VKRPDVKDVGLIVVTSDKGCAVGLNTNALRLALARLRSWSARAAACSDRDRQQGLRLHAAVLGEPRLAPGGHRRRAAHGQAGGPVKVQIDAFSQGKIGALYIVYTRFVNTMKQEPVVEQLLPLPADACARTARRRARTGTTSTSRKRAPCWTAPHPYVEQIIYQAVAENIASEQSARMVAMKAASDNASSVIDDLTLVYNKSRQAAITKELSKSSAALQPSEAFTGNHMSTDQSQRRQDRPVHRRGDRHQFPRDSMPKIYDALTSVEDGATPSPRRASRSRSSSSSATASCAPSRWAPPTACAAA
jgi:F-type H+-transporting ATPase subunit gamma